jgi:WXG100 family type VII secretion target
MSGGFGTSTDVMTSAANSVEQTSQEITQALNSLKSQLEPLAGSWKGAASGAFNNLMQEWNDDATKLTQALADISQALTGSSKNYAVAEESNQSAIAKILGGRA